MIEGIEGWREMPKYRHARRGGKLAAEAAEAAKVWAPIERSITFRLSARAPLSVNRGITCAAFSCACHQAAAMKMFLYEQGVLDKLDTENLGKINGLLESKKVLRARLNLPEAQPLQGVVTKKPILIGAALPQNSNRGMTESTTQKLGKMTETITKNKSNKMLEEYPEFFPDQGSLTTATTTDLLWLAIQTNVLGISSYSAVRLNRVIPPDFFYDAKYINSILLDELIRISTDWTTRDYDTYE